MPPRAVDRPQNILEVLAQAGSAGLGFAGKNIIPFIANKRAAEARAKQQAFQNQQARETQQFRDRQLAQQLTIQQLLEGGRGERFTAGEAGVQGRFEAGEAGRQLRFEAGETGKQSRFEQDFFNDVKKLGFAAALRNLRETTLDPVTVTDPKTGRLIQTGEFQPGRIRFGDIESLSNRVSGGPSRTRGIGQFSDPTLDFGTPGGARRGMSELDELLAEQERRRVANQ